MQLLKTPLQYLRILKKIITLFTSLGKLGTIFHW